MPFRPPTTEPGSWLGYKEVEIKNVEDKGNSHPNLRKLDVALNVNLEVKGNKYGLGLPIFGNFEWEDDGNIKPGPFLNALYFFFDTIGFKGGINIKGMWVDENDVEIDNIVDYLNTNIIKYKENEYNYYAYLYKEINDKDGKAWTRAWRRVVPNTEEDIKKFKEYVNWSKARGNLKEIGDAPKGAGPKVDGQAPQIG